MLRKQQTLDKISELIGSSNKFSVGSVGLSVYCLDDILKQLRDHKKTNVNVIKGTRRERMAKPSEYETNYRREMSEYIQQNTGIYIDPTSSVPARFYDEIADWLGL